MYILSVCVCVISFKIYFNLNITRVPCGDSRCIIRTCNSLGGPDPACIFQDLPANVCTFREMLVPTRAIRYHRFIRSPISSHLRIFYGHSRPKRARPADLASTRRCRWKGLGSGSRTRFCVQGESPTTRSFRTLLLLNAHEKYPRNFFPRDIYESPVSRARVQSINPSLHFIAYNSNRKSRSTLLLKPRARTRFISEYSKRVAFFYRIIIATFCEYKWQSHKSYFSHLFFNKCRINCRIN